MEVYKVSITMKYSERMKEKKNEELKLASRLDGDDGMYRTVVLCACLCEVQ